MKYKKSAEEVVQNAKDVGVDLLMNIGTSLKESRRAIETTEKFENVYCSIGIYPHDDREHSIEKLEQKLEDFLMRSKKIKAIGEIGIDVAPNWEGGRMFSQQAELFEMQVGLAAKHVLPIIIHNRNGDKEVLEIVQKYSGCPSSHKASEGRRLRGVCHCFTQDWDYAQKMMSCGFYLGFGGIITYPSGEYILETIKKMPLDRILIETDAPYLLPEPLRRENKGAPNEPKNVILVAQKIAEVLGMSYDEVCEITYENGKRLFGIV